VVVSICILAGEDLEPDAANGTPERLATRRPDILERPHERLLMREARPVRNRLPRWGILVIGSEENPVIRPIGARIHPR
jgi:hypothetical protein